MPAYKDKLTGLITQLIAQGASDLHLGVGVEPVVRVSGVLTPILAEKKLTPEDIEGLLDVFEDNHEMALDYLAVIAGYLLRLLEARGASREPQDLRDGSSKGRPGFVLGG